VVDRLAALMRKAGKTVGVVAIDPSSPFTGGALLGDRIRMTQHYLDKGELDEDEMRIGLKKSELWKQPLSTTFLASLMELKH